MLRRGRGMGLTVCPTWAFSDGGPGALQISTGRTSVGSSKSPGPRPLPQTSSYMPSLLHPPRDGPPSRRHRLPHHQRRSSSASGPRRAALATATSLSPSPPLPPHDLHHHHRRAAEAAATKPSSPSRPAAAAVPHHPQLHHQQQNTVAAAGAGEQVGAATSEMIWRNLAEQMAMTLTWDPSSLITVLSGRILELSPIKD
nr:unnamed protein product [Digitaria exilis]